MTDKNDKNYLFMAPNIGKLSFFCKQFANFWFITCFLPKLISNNLALNPGAIINAWG